MSKIYIGVRDQRIRELIDQLPEEQQKLTRYVEIGESYEASLTSAQTFSTMATISISAVRKQSDNKGQFKCQRCGKNHNKGECKAVKIRCQKLGILPNCVSQRLKVSKQTKKHIEPNLEHFNQQMYT